MESINVDLPTDVVVVCSSCRHFLQVKRIDSYFDDITDKQKYICGDVTCSTYTQPWKSMQERLNMYINVMGQKSAQAQGLKEPITSAVKLIQSDHRLYMMKDALANNGTGALVGILKVGVKKLFLTDGSGDQAEVNPVCLLDFYIDDSRQRQGHGFRLFKVMLELEKITPEQLAIDKPSIYLLSFLKKYYKLDKPQFHPNRYVVFPGFFRSVIGGPVNTVAEGQMKNNEQEKSHQVEVVNRNDAEEDTTPPFMAHHDTPYSSPLSSAAVKSTRGIAYVPTRFDNERKWQQMYDSWNVVGVPPRDYSYIKNARHPPLQSEIGKTIMPQSVFPKPKYTFL